MVKLTLLSLLSVTTANLFNNQGQFGPGNHPDLVVGVSKSFKTTTKLKFVNKDDEKAEFQQWKWKDGMIALKHRPSMCIQASGQRFKVASCDSGTKFIFNKDDGLLHLEDDMNLCMEVTKTKKGPIVKACQRGIIAHTTCSTQHANIKRWMHQGKRYISKTEIINDNWPKTMTEIGGETLASEVTAHLLIVESFEWLPQKLHDSRMVHRVIVLVPKDYNCDIKTKAYVHLNGYKWNVYYEDGSLKNNTVLEQEMSDGLTGQHTVSHFKETVMIAGNRGSIAVFMVDIPAQPVKFNEDDKDQFRIETEISSYGWMYVMQNPNEFEHLVMLAQAKSSIKAYNAVQDWVLDNHNFWIEEYVLAGVSKRGWTATIVGFTDHRVIGLNPTVFDMWDIIELGDLQKKSLGNWSFAMYDLYIEGVPIYIEKIFAVIKCYIDPITFVDDFVRRDIPIYHNGASGDEYMLVQNSVVTNKKLRNMGLYYNHHTLLNTNHILIMYDTNQFNQHMGHINGLFYHYAAKKLASRRLPKYDWSMVSNDDGTSTIKFKIDTSESDFIVADVSGFVADTSLATGDPEGLRLDFRASFLSQTGPKGSNIYFMPQVSTTTVVSNQVEYDVTCADKDGKGFRGMIAQVVFLLKGAAPTGDNMYIVSSPPLITPDKMNFDGCDGCLMSLVK